VALYDNLSSQCGDRSGNKRVAAQCLSDPSLIPDIVLGLENENNKIVIDCAEVLTEAALEQPALVVPHGHHLPPLLENKNNRARWEGMHALALIAGQRPDVIEPMLDRLVEIIEGDKSVIVRDYAIDAIGAYGGTGVEAAVKAFPALERSLAVWEGRHARHALDGLGKLVHVYPEKTEAIRQIASGYIDHKSGTIKKAAKSLLKLIDRG
jgi:hypothetical protein